LNKTPRPDACLLSSLPSAVREPWNITETEQTKILLELYPDGKWQEIVVCMSAPAGQVCNAKGTFLCPARPAACHSASAALSQYIQFSAVRPVIFHLYHARQPISLQERVCGTLQHPILLLGLFVSAEGIQ
jgi:hypothetical protein